MDKHTAMKMLIALYIAILCVGSYKLSEWAVEKRLVKLHSLNLLPYGPLPSLSVNHYSFTNFTRAFDSKTPVNRIGEMTKHEVETLILETFDKHNQAKLKEYLPTILEMAVDYQVDPFWVISVMMVESNFRPAVVSHKNAKGLMQVKPDTAQYLYKLMQKELSLEEADANLYEAEENIEVGVFYLKRLLHNFRMNYTHATAAYNLGPTRLRNLLRSNSIDPKNFIYYVKVRQRYEIITGRFKDKISKREKPYMNTYAYSDKGLEIDETFDQLMVPSTSENLALVKEDNFLF